LFLRPARPLLRSWPNMHESSDILLFRKDPGRLLCLNGLSAKRYFDEEEPNL